ncbi:hypothetical protein PG994_001403 [Apiospora phragmitis]|uniref:Uncharacterized protein n=1 Tax=Apiospora phragmitis TaxID=2905665 RepID=A0ABR1WTG2_9PEZI
MAPGKTTAGRATRKAPVAGTRPQKRAAPPSGADNAAASSSKRRKTEENPTVAEGSVSDYQEEASEYEEDADAFSPPPAAKSKATKRGANKGKAPAAAKPKRAPRQSKPKPKPTSTIVWMKDHSDVQRPPYIPGSFKWVQESKPTGKKAEDGKPTETGRKLISWSRERMYEKLLLNMYYECSKSGLDIPWEKIAHRLEPGTSKDAMLQTLERLRQTVLAEGHMVPPELGTKDHWTRGFTRVYPDSFQDEDILYSRPVGWLEEMDHPKERNPTADRLTFNGQFKFKVTYTASTAPIPEMFKPDTSKRQNETRLSAAQVIAQLKGEEEEEGSVVSSSPNVDNDTSEDVAGDEDDFAEVDDDGEEEYEDEEDYEEAEDGVIYDEHNPLPNINQSPANHLPIARRVPGINNTPQQENGSLPAHMNSPATPGMMNTGGPVYQDGTQHGYWQHMSANAAANYSTPPNCYAAMNGSSSVDPSRQQILPPRRAFVARNAHGSPAD